MKAKRFFIALLIVGLCCTVLGCGIFCIGFAAADWKVLSIGNVVIETKEYKETAETPINNLTIDFNNAKLDVEFSETADSVSVTYPLSKTHKGKTLNHVAVTEGSGSLTIVETTEKRTVSMWNFTNPIVSVILPSARTYTLSLTTNNGNVRLNGTLCETDSLLLESDNGDIACNVASLVCANDATLKTDNGDIRIGNFTAKTLTVNTNNGDVSLGNAEGKADEITFTTINGDVKANGILIAETIVFKTVNGDIEAEDGLLNGTDVLLFTTMGDVEATLYGTQAMYATTVDKGLGDTNIYTNLDSVTNADRSLKVGTTLGDIEIFFRT